jgi:hypothetical protein
MTNSQIILYKTQTGEIKIDVHLEDDTVWLNRHQLSNLFDRDIKTIGKHIGKILTPIAGDEPGDKYNFLILSLSTLTFLHSSK